jgi:riboflavin synthase
MFTGLIQAVGAIRRLEETYLAIDGNLGSCGDPIASGESISVNGCCLTAVLPGVLEFELSPETSTRTAFHRLETGSPVNLERAMRAADRFGGHIVQGHVDTVGEVVAVLQDGDFTVLRFRAPAEFDRYLIDKGSIAVDGISLTVVNPVEGEFDVWAIPHTVSHTNLRAAVPGQKVNLEFDMVAKYLEKLAFSQ